MKRILVGTDFSPAGRRALYTAAAWARDHGASLRIVHVVPSESSLASLWRTDHQMATTIQRQASAKLKKLADTLDARRQLEISTGIHSGAASVELLRTARDFQADLLVVGTRGEREVRGRQPMLGDTSLKLVSRSRVPLLLVRNEGMRAPASVVAAIALSSLARDVLTAAHESLASGGQLRVFHAYESPFAARLAAYDLTERTNELYSEAEEQRRRDEIEALIASIEPNGGIAVTIERGDPIDLLLTQLEQLQPELLVLGKHGSRAGRKPADWLGSVSRYMAHFAPTNVLIVPPRKD